MEALIPQVADASSNLLAARNQMGFTLGFHIVLACFGVAFPAMMLIAEWRGRKREDEAALRLARNWSKAVAVLIAVGQQSQDLALALGQCRQPLRGVRAGVDPRQPAVDGGEPILRKDGVGIITP